MCSLSRCYGTHAPDLLMISPWMLSLDACAHATGPSVMHCSINQFSRQIDTMILYTVQNMLSQPDVIVPPTAALENICK